jgi:nucleotide-binding universal stress UspA family protein
MYQHIMVPLDSSELAECVFPHLVTIAEGSKGVKISIVYVIEPLHIRGGLDSRLDDQARQELEELDMEKARNYLDRIVKRLKYEGAVVETKVLHGKVAEELVNYANENAVDLVIISTHGHSGISRWDWGNVADKLLRSVNAPVLIVRAPGYAMSN